MSDQLDPQLEAELSKLQSEIGQLDQTSRILTIEKQELEDWIWKELADSTPIPESSDKMSVTKVKNKYEEDIKAYKKRLKDIKARLEITKYVVNKLKTNGVPVGVKVKDHVRHLQKVRLNKDVPESSPSSIQDTTISTGSLENLNEHPEKVYEIEKAPKVRSHTLPDNSASKARDILGEHLKPPKAITVALPEPMLSESNGYQNTNKTCGLPAVASQPVFTNSYAEEPVSLKEQSDRIFYFNDLTTPFNSAAGSSCVEVNRPSLTSSLNHSKDRQSKTPNKSSANMLGNVRLRFGEIRRHFRRTSPATSKLRSISDENVAGSVGRASDSSDKKPTDFGVTEAKSVQSHFLSPTDLRAQLVDIESPFKRRARHKHGPGSLDQTVSSHEQGSRGFHRPRTSDACPSARSNTGSLSSSGNAPGGGGAGDSGRVAVPNILSDLLVATARSTSGASNGLDEMSGSCAPLGYGPLGYMWPDSAGADANMQRHLEELLSGQMPLGRTGPTPNTSLQPPEVGPAAVGSSAGSNSHYPVAVSGGHSSSSHQATTSPASSDPPGGQTAGSGQIGSAVPAGGVFSTPLGTRNLSFTLTLLYRQQQADLARLVAKQQSTYRQLTDELVAIHSDLNEVRDAVNSHAMQLDSLQRDATTREELFNQKLLDGTARLDALDAKAEESRQILQREVVSLRNDHRNALESLEYQLTTKTRDLYDNITTVSNKVMIIEKSAERSSVHGFEGQSASRRLILYTLTNLGVSAVAFITTLLQVLLRCLNMGATLLESRAVSMMFMSVLLITFMTYMLPQFMHPIWNTSSIYPMPTNSAAHSTRLPAAGILHLVCAAVALAIWLTGRFS